MSIVIWVVVFGIAGLSVDLLPIPPQIKTVGRAAIIAFAVIFILQAFYRALPAQ